jgi:3-hydroxybutyryl-CoA dehydrogenase
MYVCVLGAGTMGHGIAQVSAMGGHDVVLRDVDRELVDEGLASIRENLQQGVDLGKLSEAERAATLDRIEGETDLCAAGSGADLVVEAIPEDLDLKRETFETVERHVDDETVLATNTSSLSVTAIADAVAEPGRVLGLHFFNPPHLMELVEVVVAERTTDETRSFGESFVEGIDRTPVTVQDSPGFASSRLGVTLGVEAIRMVQQGVASVEDVDAAMELGYNHPMGPLELTDHVGLDVRLDVLDYLRAELGERFRPPQLLKRKVRAGKLGKKTGEGFYVWEDGEPVGVSGGDRP